ncbi:MAG: ATP-dependent helicase [Lachnospiraceae bacterium]|nr:ATP-dependent helicase [Lachnospiraceae bacterium]
MKENKAQYEAIRHNKGPARILAGPGAGKTYVLVNRISYLIDERKVPPDKILVITFTKAAANQMQQRFAKLRGTLLPVHFHTFHSLFYFFLKQSHIYSDFSILTNQDKIRTISHIKNTIKAKFPGEPYVSNDYLATIIAYYLNKGTFDREETILKEETTGFVISQYLSLITAEKKLDFDDFANKALEVFEKFPKLLERIKSNYEYILIDEFQDINPRQYEVIKELASDHRNLFVVGDDDQAIYGFRGAEPSIMRQFEEDYPDCSKVLLASNYRCSKEILDFACECIKGNKDRVEKELFAERGQQTPVVLKPCKTAKIQSSEIVSFIKEYSGNLSDIAIICRTNAMLDRYGMILRKENVSYFCKDTFGKGICDIGITKDILSYFKIACGRADRTDYLRITDKGSLDVVRGIFRKHEVDFKAIIKANNEDFVLREKLMSFDRKMALMRRMDPLCAIGYIMKALKYENYLMGLRLRNPSECALFERTLETLKEMAEDFDGLLEFVDFMAEFSVYEKEKLEKERYLNANSSPNSRVAASNQVNLLTMHGSKGLEFPCVILPDINDGKMPHTRSSNPILIEEERRLFYVAMTRARDLLVLTFLGAPDDYRNHPSKFMPGRLVEKAMAQAYTHRTSDGDGGREGVITGGH